MSGLLKRLSNRRKGSIIGNPKKALTPEEEKDILWQIDVQNKDREYYVASTFQGLHYCSVNLTPVVESDPKSLSSLLVRKTGSGETFVEAVKDGLEQFAKEKAQKAKDDDIYKNYGKKE